MQDQADHVPCSRLPGSMPDVPVQTAACYVTLHQCSSCSSGACCALPVQEGRSQWSAIHPISTAASLPSCPVALKLGQVTRTAVSLSWSPPADDGGSAVQEYEVRSSNSSSSHVQL